MPWAISKQRNGKNERGTYRWTTQRDAVLLAEERRGLRKQRREESKRHGKRRREQETETENELREQQKGEFCEGGKEEEEGLTARSRR
jgi:hypothetical protein